MRQAGILTSLLLLLGLAHAGVIKVPTDQPTIQAGIDASSDFDTVLVEPGTYTGVGNQNISFMGKSLAIIGEQDRDVTIIDLTGTGMKAFNLWDTLIPTNLEIANLTIRGASYGIAGDAANMLFKNIRLVACDTGFYSYAFEENYATIQSSSFDSNSIAIRLNGGVISDCSFIDNTVGLFNESSPLLQLLVTSSIFSNNDRATDFGAFFKKKISEPWPCDSWCSIFDSCLFLENGVALIGRFEVSNSVFDGNGNAWVGGGSKHINATSCSFANHVSTVFEAGTENVIQLTDCIVENNADTIFRRGWCEEFCYDRSVWIFANTIFRANPTGGLIKHSHFDMQNCEYANNGPILFEEARGRITIKGNNFISNPTGVISFRWVTPDGIDSISNNIFFNNQQYGLKYIELFDSMAIITCNNFFDNDTNYIGIPNQTGLNGNISVDPLFCDTANGDYTLYSHSPCAPANNSCGVQMGAYGVGCAEPLVSELLIDGSVANQHILDHSPLLEWTGNTDTLAKPQFEYEIAVGTDNDWQFAELWNPAPFIGSQTSREYNGSPLSDNDSGYVRVRLFDGLLWSNWHTASFRLNTPPTAPALSDTTPVLVSATTPTLYLQNATDEQNDALSYDYEVYSNNTLTTLVASGNSSETPDSTGWVVSPPLSEDAPFWWRAKSFDGYEYSGWSQTGSFYTNSMSSSPSASSLISPPDSSGKLLFNMLPTFDWSTAVDPDPFDTIRYKLEISINVGFTFVNTIDSISNSQLTLTDSLEFGKHYWWRVTAFDTDGLTAQSGVKDFWTWMLGDVNHSHTVNIQDLNYMVNYFFSGGPSISPFFVGDINGNCGVNVQDLIYLVAYFFSGGPAPKVGCGP